MSALLKYARPEVDLERPVLVVGVGRSGTSLLQSMLNAHPELCFPPETHFFRKHVAGAAAPELWRAGERERLTEALERDDDFARAGLSPAELLDDPLASAGPAGAFRALLWLVGTGQGKPRVGDKDPKNIDYLPALKAAFPGSRVIHVVRDPRDVLLSRTKAAWSAHRPWWVHPLIYREQMRRGRALGRELFGAGYLELRYEDLIHAPEASLKRVCEHAHLFWTPAMLHFGESAAQLVDERELSWKRETLGPLLSNNSGKWREGLSARQVAYAEAVCAETFADFGYERSVSPGPCMRALAPLLCTGVARAYDLKLGRRVRT